MKKQLMSDTFTHKIVDSSQVELPDAAAVTIAVTYNRKAPVASPDVINAYEGDECLLKFTTVITVSSIEYWK